MRDWVPADHPVWLIISVVQRLDTRPVHALRKTGGVGRAGYDPDMLLTLLIWSWSQGQRSSRRIERLCHEDVAYRIICAGDAPDHATISRFRAGLDTVVQDLFAQVLVLCASLGMGRLGVVALDGVKIASDASKSANRTEATLLAMATEAAKAEAATAAAEHAATDADDDDLFGSGGRGDQVPPDVVDPRTRSARIAAALEQVRQTAERKAVKLNRVTPKRIARAEQKLEAARAAQQAVIDAHQARAARFVEVHGRKPSGTHPTPVQQRRTVTDAARVLANLERRAATQGAPPKTVANVTDPESRLQPLRGGGWAQGYNCQAVTSSDGLIIAVSVSNNPVDAPTFQPMMNAAVTAATLITTHQPAGTMAHTPDTNNDPADPADPSPIGLFLADAGYLSDTNLTCAGPDRLIAIGKHRHLETAAVTTPTSGTPPRDTTPVEAMTHRLRTEEGITTYRQRSHIAETPFGHFKHNLGFRRFTGRGLTRATTEWTLNALTYNIFKALTGNHITTA